MRKLTPSPAPITTSPFNFKVVNDPIYTPQEILKLIDLPTQKIRVQGIVRYASERKSHYPTYGEIEVDGNIIGFKLPSSQAPQKGDPIVIEGMLSLEQDYKSTSYYRYVLRITGSIVGTYQPITQWEAKAPINLKQERVRVSLSEAIQKANLKAAPQRASIVVFCSNTAQRDMEQQLEAYGHDLSKHCSLHFIRIPFYSDQEAINKINETLKSGQYSPDILMLARGGGDPNEIAVTANSSSLVQTLIDTNLPFYSGVGHATDVTLVDKFADGCFHTPTALATEITQSQRDFINNYYDNQRKRKLEDSNRELEQELMAGMQEIAAMRKSQQAARVTRSIFTVLLIGVAILGWMN